MKPEPTILGLATAAIVGILAALILPSCVQVSQTDPRTGVTTKATISMSKGAYVTVQGPVPSVTGLMPTVNKKGVVTGYKPVFGPVTPETPTALFAAYDLDQTDVPKQALKAVRDYGISLAAGEVVKYLDDNKVSVDKKTIDSQTQATTEANNLKGAAETNRHTEAMAEFEVAPTTTTTP